jgi:hypothetical protein
MLPSTVRGLDDAMQARFVRRGTVVTLVVLYVVRQGDAELVAGSPPSGPPRHGGGPGGAPPPFPMTAAMTWRALAEMIGFVVR